MLNKQTVRKAYDYSLPVECSYSVLQRILRAVFHKVNLNTISNIFGLCGAVCDNIERKLIKDGLI
jgi:hypothetical protein